VIRIETTIQKCDTDLLNSIPIVGRVWRYQSGNTFLIYQGRIQDFKLGGGHLKKLRQAEGGAKIFGVFRVKNHDFTPKNLIFPILGGGRAPGATPHPWIRPCICISCVDTQNRYAWRISYFFLSTLCFQKI
jgi:hypothetical protein